MTYVERKEEQLKQQIIPQTMESDFEAFWKNAVAALRAVPLRVERKLLDLPYKTFKAYEVTFNTYDDTMVRGYFCVPNTGEGKKLPCVAVFHGGGGYRGIQPEIVATGVCTFSMDTRSQGGKTFDRAFYEDVCDYNGSGIMAHGLADKENHYMKNIYLDAVRAIDVIESFPEVDASRIVAHGLSQGGALTIAAAALSGKVKKAYPCVHSYACLERRVELGSGVFEAVKRYLNRYPAETDAVLRTLSYFDINNLVSLLRVPTDFFLGLSDPICLPPFVYSPYAHTKAEKRSVLSPLTGHDISYDYKMELYRAFAAL